ncbi:MAG: flagellar protein FlgN [Nitrospirae bacterium]|nr:flagellar protein FlgN [Nitrospirota bacterium]
MTQLYEDLINALEKEFSLCTQMVELLQREKDVIVSLDPRALESLLSDKEAITTQIRVCDETRERILDALGFKNKTISEVARMADSGYREKLTAIASKFTSIIHSISELNRFNSVLIEKSLYYIKTSYNFLSSFDVSARQKISVEA